jgi:hypothetical protein
MRKRPLIIFDDNLKRGKSAQANIRGQNLLLKGMVITGNMDKAADMAGIKTAVELYRTLDRLALRKGYHKALSDEGIDLQWIVQRIKGHADGPSGQVSMQALRMLLTSLGLNQYSVEEEGQKNWEDTLLKISNEYDAKQLPAPTASYTVNVPKEPEKNKQMRSKEQQIGKELYEDQSRIAREAQGPEVLSGEFHPDQDQGQEVPGVHAERGPEGFV